MNQKNTPVDACCMLYQYYNFVGDIGTYLASPPSNGHFFAN